MNYSKWVGSLISVARASTALFTIAFLIIFSSSGFKDGFPTGWGIATVGTIRLAPTDSEIVVMVAI